MSTEPALQESRGRTFQKGVEGKALSWEGIGECLRCRGTAWRAWGPPCEDQERGNKVNRDWLDHVKSPEQGEESELFLFSVMEATWALLRFYLFIFRDRVMEGEKRRRARQTLSGPLLPTPSWGAGAQPRCVLWLGMKPVTFWFVGWHPTHWMEREKMSYFIYI